MLLVLGQKRKEEYHFIIKKRRRKEKKNPINPFWAEIRHGHCYSLHFSNRVSICSILLNGAAVAQMVERSSRHRRVRGFYPRPCSQHIVSLSKTLNPKLLLMLRHQCMNMYVNAKTWGVKHSEWSTMTRTALYEFWTFTLFVSIFM